MIEVAIAIVGVALFVVLMLLLSPGRRTRCSQCRARVDPKAKVCPHCGHRFDSPAPGWYSDPNAPGGQRYWDGSAWTEHTGEPPTRSTTKAPPFDGASS